MGPTPIGFEIIKYAIGVLITLISVYFMFKNKISSIETGMKVHEQEDDRRFTEIKEISSREVERLEKKFDEFAKDRKDESGYIRSKLDKIQSDISDVRVKLAEK